MCGRYVVSVSDWLSTITKARTGLGNELGKGKHAGIVGGNARFARELRDVDRFVHGSIVSVGGRTRVADDVTSATACRKLCELSSGRATTIGNGGWWRTVRPNGNCVRQS